MQSALTIGEFARITHLSVKTLRHYHDWGVLEPATVDPDSGYRYYTTDQVPAAQVIRRFRDLEMPVEQVKAVMAAPDLAARNELISAHLKRMEDQLTQTRDAVASLRALVERPPAPIAIEHRSLPATESLAITATVPRDGLLDWWLTAFDELYAALHRDGIQPEGPAGGLFAHELFEDEIGEVTLLLPVARRARASGRAYPLPLPAAELAVAVHEGPHDDVDLTYGALGTHVSEAALGVQGPVRERYLVGRRDTPDAARWRTEIAWPIVATVGR
jgi:DNA-binding transcriptional MerR regulator/effector-binding domain-containing protein